MASTAAIKTTAVRVESFGQPEVLNNIVDVDLPPLGPTQVLLKIHASGINPSDTYIRLGPGGPYAGTKLLPNLPYTPHKDGSGVVEAVGAEVKGLAAGDRVYCRASVTGTLAHHAICEASAVYPLPDEVTFQQGACLGVPCATAYYALHVRARVAAGESVFIHGASGAVGLAAVQLAKAAGAYVVGSAGTEEGKKAVEDAGADFVVIHRRIPAADDEGAKDYLDLAKEKKARMLPDGGFDVVLEMAAHSNLPSDLKLVGRRGRICIIGSRAEEVSVNPRAFMSVEAQVMGVFMPMASPEELAFVHKGLIYAMRSKQLVPVVGRELPMTEAAQAHTDVMSPPGGGAAGNIVLVPEQTG